MSGLHIENLDAWYGHFQALFGVPLSVAPGESLALVGANGAGKTTLLRAVMDAVTHRAVAFADRFCCLISGRITLSGTCEGADFEAIAAAYFGEGETA